MKNGAKIFQVKIIRIKGVKIANARPSGRTTMEMILRWLGRPDLAKYVRENRRSSIDYYYDTENLADTLEFPGHRVSKRHTSEKDKKKKKNKKNNKRKQKNSKTQNKKVGKAVAATGAHAKVNKNHHDLKKKDNRHSRQPNNSTNKYIAHTSMYCSILLILFFITICLVAAYYFYKRNSTKARGICGDPKRTKIPSPIWNGRTKLFARVRIWRSVARENVRCAKKVITNNT